MIIHIDYEPDVGAYEDDIYLIDGVELMPTTLAQATCCGNLRFQITDFLTFYKVQKPLKT